MAVPLPLVATRGSNVVYAFFDTFGIVHNITGGGPAGSTTILVYKIYQDGFIGLDLGSS